MRKDTALEYRAMIEKAAALLPDTDAAGAPGMFPVWKPGEHYKADDRRRDGNILYKCLQEHNAQAGWIPSASPSLWAKVLIPDPGKVPAWEQPDSTNPYAKGDRVTHKGQTWVSDVDGNVWEPGVHGWTAI